MLVPSTSGLTQTIYRLGQFVLDHHTRPNAVSRVVPPGELPISFKLSLVWSQQTFDSPSQIWRATSDYSLKVGTLVLVLPEVVGKL